MKQTLLLLLAIIAIQFSYACKCHVLAFSQEVAQADEIFFGTVLKKTTNEKAYYLFAVSTTFKGQKNDSLTIKTGIGGPDCGMEFEIGKTYLVYSFDRQTSRCRRNAIANNNPDLGKLKYLFDTSFSTDIGKTINPSLTNNEAEYLNYELFSQRKDFDFKEKKVAFVLSKSFISKQQYFKNWGGKEAVSTLIILATEEKQKTNGYDAIIVLWNKQTISEGFRKRLISKLE